MSVVHLAGGVLVVVGIAAWRRRAAAAVGWTEVGTVAVVGRRRAGVGDGQRLAAVVAVVMMVAAAPHQRQLHVAEVLVVSAAFVVHVIRTGARSAPQVVIVHHLKTLTYIRCCLQCFDAVGWAAGRASVL